MVKRSAVLLPVIVSSTLTSLIKGANERGSVKMSIYERIHQIIEKEGRVPYDFELEERNQDDNEIRFAPGALEGILGHHTNGKGGDGRTLALFNMSENEQVKPVLITLGCCEEFTDYVLTNILDWPEEEQNKVYFELARKLAGWGKITAVEQLKADTEEIREWILCEGCRNEILYSYLGLECAQKCDYLERLRAGRLDEKEFQGAADIMNGLLEEGPCLGISILENAGETIYWYLCQYENRKPDIKYYSQFLQIKDCLESENKDEPRDGNALEWRQKAINKLNKILSAIDIKSLVLESLKENTYAAVSVAKQMKINIGNELFALMESDFEKYYMQGHYFFTQKQYVEEYVALAEKNLNYEKLPTGMGNSLGLDKQEYWSVDMIVQYLEEYPGLGKELVRVSLKAPITRWRYMAAKTLEGWKERTNQNLSEADADLYQDVRKVAEEECDENLQKRWADLLEKTVK